VYAPESDVDLNLRGSLVSSLADLDVEPTVPVDVHLQKTASGIVDFGLLT
jgi:hypothetical protein